MQKNIIEDVIVLAKQKNLNELKSISNSIRFVEVISQIIHQLQSERGASCLYLASSGKVFAEERIQILAKNNVLQDLFIKFNTDHIFLNDKIDAKQLNLITWILLGLDNLDLLRRKVSLLEVGFSDCFEAYNRLIGSLIGLIFEITDSTRHGKISRILVTFYNLIQGKESAGQERAVGSYMYGLGLAEADKQIKLSELIESQERSFELFYEFASTSLRAAWDNLNNNKAHEELLRYRHKLISTKTESAPLRFSSGTWFEICSCRLNAIGDMESTLIVEMKATIELMVGEAESDLKHLQNHLKNSQTAETTNLPNDVLMNPNIPLQSPYYFANYDLARAYPVESILSVLQQQSEKITEMDIELSKVKKALSERKVIDQAKGLLMIKLSISESEAYQSMRSMAMEQNRKISEVAENILTKFRS